MESMMTFAQLFLDWLLQTTVIASLVICLIVAFQKTLGGRLGPRWCHALWLVLIVRMVLPWAPSSRLSLFNLVPSWDRQVQRQQPSETTKGQGIHGPARTANAVDEPTTQGPESEVVIREQAAPEPLTVGDVPTELRSWPISLRPVLSILWLAGAMVIGAYILVSDFALWRIVKRDRVLVNQEMLELFEQCKEKMDVQSLVAVVPSDEVRSPGLFGFVRPRLLLPREMLDTATHEEMRYVFLHELAHLKRRDIYLGWLTSLLQILHWFNPLVWFAFYRMRMDRELACDALVLTRTGQDKSHEYGGAILGLLRRFSRPRRLPAMAGIVENRSQLKRRIAMITQFKKNSYKWSPLAVMLIVVLACISLPNSEHIIASETSGPMVAAQPTFTKIRIPTETPWSMQLSPDGRKVSLVSDKKLWIMPTRGKLGLDIPGEPVAVNTAGVLVEWTGHAWSADGKWIAFNELMPMRRNTPERKGKQSIYVVSSEGGRPTKVCETYPGERTPNYRISLSPGGETVAFSSVGVEGKEQHIYTIPVGGGEPRRLVDIQAREPVFSPDGTMIAFVEDSNGGRRGGGLCVVSAQGGTPNRIADAVYASSPVWSPGGDMIAFLDYAANDRQINFVRISDDARGVGETIQIDAPEGIKEVWLLAGWSSDGKIGAIFKRPAETGLYTLSVKGGKAVQVARGGRIPRWFPDGTRISCVDSPKKSKGMWHGLALGSVPAEGGMFVAIPLQSDTKMGLAGFGVGNRVSPDGKKIVFSGKVQGKPPVFSHNHVWTVPVEGGTPKQLSEATEGTTHMFPCWSPDGKTVAFIRGKMPDILSSMSAIRTDICTVPAGGGKPSVLTTVSDDVNFGPIAWSPDGNRIAYYSETDRASSTVILKTVSANGEGRVRIIGTVDEPHYGKEFAWSPDSKRIAFNGPDGKTISIMSVEDGSTVNIETGLIDSNVGTQLDWSHDGARLVFVGGKGESSEFWTMENFLPQTPVVKPAHKPHFRKIKIASKPKNGVLSPDGSKMAFVSEDAVWVVPLHGKVDPDIAGEPVRLAEAPGIWDNGSLMAWSADGKWIAVNAKPDEQDTVHVIPVAGGESRVVQMPTRGGHSWSYRLGLSPDGQMLAFSAIELGKSLEEVTWSNERYIYTIPTAGGEPKQVSSGWGRLPSFSPDGKFIAYVGYRKREAWQEDRKLPPFHGDLWVVPSAGGTPVKLATVDGRLRGPVWSPDGRYIAAHHEPGSDNGSKEIWVFPLSPDASSTGEPEKIVLPNNSGKMLAGWTPKGELGVFLASKSNWAGYTVPASGGKAVQVTPGSNFPYYPRWSHDGQRIFLRYVRRDEAPSVRMGYVPADGGALVDIPWPEQPFMSRVPGGGHNVSPDGERIVIVAAQMPYDPKKGIDVWTIPLDGGLPTRLTNGRTFEGYPCWSPDGEQIAFTAEESFNAIYIVPAAGGQTRQVSSESDSVGGGAIAFSANGKRIAFFSDSSIKTIPVEGGEPEVLVGEVKPGRHSQLAYSPDGSKIAHNAEGKIWITSLGKGKPEELRTGLPENAKLSEFGWSPDGKKIAFIASIGGEAEFWLIEDFLPKSIGK